MIEPQKINFNLTLFSGDVQYVHYLPIVSDGIRKNITGNLIRQTCSPWLFMTRNQLQSSGYKFVWFKLTAFPGKISMGEKFFLAA